MKTTRILLIVLAFVTLTGASFAELKKIPLNKNHSVFTQKFEKKYGKYA